MHDDLVSIELKEEALDSALVSTHCRVENVGAFVLFEGIVRFENADDPVEFLDFEAYRPMAEKELRKISQELFEKWDIKRVAIHHRIGRVFPGELAVIIGVGAKHRKAAFEACAFAIDTLKERVPIWKKQVHKSGEFWVSAHP